MQKGKTLYIFTSFGFFGKSFEVVYAILCPQTFSTEILAEKLAVVRTFVLILKITEFERFGGKF